MRRLAAALALLASSAAAADFGYYSVAQAGRRDAPPPVVGRAFETPLEVRDFLPDFPADVRYIGMPRAKLTRGQIRYRPAARVEIDNHPEAGAMMFAEIGYAKTWVEAHRACAGFLESGVWALPTVPQARMTMVVLDAKPISEVGRRRVFAIHTGMGGQADHGTYERLMEKDERESQGFLNKIMLMELWDGFKGVILSGSFDPEFDGDQLERELADAPEGSDRRREIEQKLEATRTGVPIYCVAGSLATIPDALDPINR